MIYMCLLFPTTGVWLPLCLFYLRRYATSL
jgi:hypothetical protein